MLLILMYAISALREVMSKYKFRVEGGWGREQINMCGRSHKQEQSPGISRSGEVHQMVFAQHLR